MIDRLKNIYNFITFISFRYRDTLVMLKRLWHIYRDGFSHLPRWGKILVAIVLVKLLIMFVVFKLLFMPNYLNSRYTTEEEKSNHVLNELTTKP